MGFLKVVCCSYPLPTAEQSLRDGEQPAAVKEKWAEPGVEPQFQLRLRASGIIRVQHRLTGDQEVVTEPAIPPSLTSLSLSLSTDVPESDSDSSHDVR